MKKKKKFGLVESRINNDFDMRVDIVSIYFRKGKLYCGNYSGFEIGRSDIQYIVGCLRMGITRIEMLNGKNLLKVKEKSLRSCIGMFKLAEKKYREGY